MIASAPLIVEAFTPSPLRGVQVNTVKGDTLRPNANHRDVWADFAIEAILVHAQVSGRVPKPNEPRSNWSHCCRISHAASGCNCAEFPTDRTDAKRLDRSLMSGWRADIPALSPYAKCPRVKRRRTGTK